MESYLNLILGIVKSHTDDNELKAQDIIKEQLDKIEYPHFTIDQISEKAE
ncbi:hypothetical protein ACR3IL_03440 [Streptococcus iniae]|nr:hypothetical protein [Streptococcus iniae]ESR08853.1 hypothetical protein IUSA1_10010 [Streptococcus iniae IUSA1]